MTIVVDTREPFEIQALGDKIEKLEFGDFHLVANNEVISIERKTPQGYITDLHSGRLNQQLVGCRYILMDIRAHGLDFMKYFDYEGSKMNLEQFLNSINGTSLHHSILYGLSLPHMSKMLRRYEEKLAKGELGQLQVAPIKNDMHRSLDILSRFEGVGVERAKLLLKRFGNLDAVFVACATYQTIPDVGPVTMSKVSERLFENYVEGGE